ncbi:MAG TPA: hypothetical protein VFA65_15615 [Bryobacteraceae bacterium]|nr:hypothetical protein [Bryobacteraceae bacterium]
MTLTIDLPAEQIAALNDRAEAAGVSAEECAGALLRQALAPTREQPLSVRIRDLWADIPDAVRAKLPSDGADQHDHYVYGSPKREQ